jgi:phospholipid/cholesterol/gamma-HCH transport system permease protein
VSSSPAAEGAAAAPLTFETKEDGLLRLVLAGEWSGQKGLPSIKQLEQQCGPNGSIKAVAFEAGNLGRWNSSLIAFILQCKQYCDAHGIEFRGDGLPAGAANLIKMAKAAPVHQAAEGRVIARASFLQRVGESSMQGWSGLVTMVTFVGENVLAILKMLRGKAQFRWQDAFLVMDQCGPQALGIVALINFLVGLILAFVGAVELARFGASIYVADLVAVATVREMGCIMTGIVLCGRTGAAFAAQLGTMKVNQEIDAFVTFSISPLEFLVLPRVVALVLMMPLLCLFADLISITGGFLVSSLMLHITPVLYIHRTLEAITLTSFCLGIIKGSFFGVLVALTGCLRGMQCGSNAAAVGEATTRAVVTGITAIIASDGAFAVICNALGI